MANAAVDHMVSLIIFMAALLVFIGFFTQNMQTGLAYQQHSALSTKTSDLIDNVLLNTGLPSNWSKSDGAITAFGLHKQASQYQMDPRAMMRLNPSSSTVFCSATGANYSNISTGGK